VEPTESPRLGRYAAHACALTELRGEWGRPPCQLSIALTIFTFIKAGVIGDDEISSIAGEGSKQTLEDAAGVELDAASSNKDALLGMAVLMTITTVLLFFFTLAMLSKLSVATKILKVAVQAVMVRPQTCQPPLVVYAC
jgi:hypothetical protein